MSNPLNVLREYNFFKKPIIERNNQVIFGANSWPKTTQNNYLVCGSGKDGTQKKYYTLECLLYFIKNASLSHPKYVEQAAAENIPAVRRPDRKKLLAYLKGDSSTMSSSIDKNGPIKDITIVYDKEAEIETNELRAKLGLIKSEETNNSSKIIDISKGRF
ncbi:parafibromin isoform X1 [Parasteatoda tepidariorum]|uniref:parafibromin isoform X1 n=1 Tax=Parasteatoda tepidariorum TaxID=114398 RepID=UPI001C726926|nr:parafibromin isoform X1 [Parasteatoda tepidariorum]